MTNPKSRLDLAHDLILPTLLFAALGGMTWAVRGCSGFGAVAGCVFAGVTWGAAWWYISHDPCRDQSRRYSSGWIVLALTFGIGLSGARGWMQWHNFFEEKLVTNAGRNEFVPISRAYGFLWMFIAGMPWAGIGACVLAWCGSLRETRIWHWVIRIAYGVFGALLARYLFDAYPQYFLPLYESLESQYQDLEANPSLRRLINDNGAAISHLGYFVGFLAFEIGRKDWKNVVLILTVGVVNGAGWALCQCWTWAPSVWPNGNFNWWRCWESSGGISIGIAYGIAYFLVNRRMSDRERAVVTSQRTISGPNFEWLLIYLGLASFLSVFARYQMGGWGNLYFSFAIAFGTIYYLLNRQTVGDRGETRKEARSNSTGVKFEWGSMLLTLALIVGLFLRDILSFFEQVGESSGTGRNWMQVGLIYLCAVLGCGVAWFVIRRKTLEAERAGDTCPGGDPNLERLGLYLGLLAGLGLSIRNGLKGWFNIYLGNEDHWSRVLWQILGPVYLIGLVAIFAWVLFRPIPRNFNGDLFPGAHWMIGLVLIVQNVIAQLITGPLTQWNEMAFSIYYMLLFAITAVIVFHFHSVKRAQAASER